MSDLKWNHSLKFPLELEISEVVSCTTGLKLVWKKSGQYNFPPPPPQNLYTVQKKLQNWYDSRDLWSHVQWLSWDGPHIW